MNSGTPRQNFNWGFHDAQDDMQRGRQKRDVAEHFNAVYGLGYLYGWKYPQTDTSEPAWRRCDSIRAQHVEITKSPSGYAYRIEAPGLIVNKGGFASHMDAANAATGDLLGMIASSLIEI